MVRAGVDAGAIVAAVLGVALAATMWWIHVDVTALAAERSLSAAPVGRVQNEMARDAYSFLHFPMIAGVVLVALGLKSTIAHVDRRLTSVTAAALAGGAAEYLLAHVAFRYRIVRSISVPRLVVAAALVTLAVFADQVEALVALAGAVALMVALVVDEVLRFAEGREQIRHRVVGAE